MLDPNIILSFISSPRYEPLKYNEIADALKIDHEDMPELSKVLDNLVLDGKIVKGKKGRYSVPETLGLIAGTYSASRSGENGFFIPKSGTMDVFIPKADSNQAMHNDLVLVKVVKPPIGKNHAEGKVKSILKRHNKTIVGLLIKRNRQYFLEADDKRLNIGLSIAAKHLNGATVGDKVVAAITQYPKAGAAAKGEVVEKLGASENAGVDILSVIKSFNLPTSFPKDVLAQASAIKDTIDPKEIEGRLDLRGETIITIDGEDAKDLDDAISVKKNGEGFKLGVHIADVTHYVTENSPLDKDAFNRGTSVYFPDRVVPMLPPELSNGICSLHGNVDRLTLSVLMDIDKNGAVIDYRIEKSVIRSAERMTYKNVTALLTGDCDSELKDRYSNITPMLDDAKKLAALLRKKRFEAGSVDFDLPEPKVILDESGRTVDVIKFPVSISNHIIEEFMLVCNRIMARHAFDTECPFVYRIHEPPTEEKLAVLKLFLKNIPLKYKLLKEKVSPIDIQRLLKSAQGIDAERAVNTITLRSMSKAKYSPINMGHFGLAADYYCHFTSPIRRYPDLVIHRILKEQLDRGITEKRREFLEGFVQSAATRSSETEINAVEAERDADKLKMCEYMSERIGQEFEGIVSSITEFGMFVELDNTIEGMISLPSLIDDYYIFDKNNYCLIGEHGGKVYTIGSRVNIVVAASDPAMRRIDFVIAEMYEEFMNSSSAYDKSPNKRAAKPKTKSKRRK